MRILQSISLDFGRDTVPITVFAKQNDTKTRYIEITPLNRGQAYTLEDGITPRLQLTKADGHTVIDDAETKDGVIIAELTPQALAAEGVAVAEIGLYKGEELLSSQTFYIDVKRTAYDKNAPTSSDEYNALVKAFVEVDEAKEKAETATQGANSAAANATAAKVRADEATATANKAAEAAMEAAGAVGDNIDGVVIVDTDNSQSYLGKIRIIGGFPALEFTKI